MQEAAASEQKAIKLYSGLQGHVSALMSQKGAYTQV